MSEVPLYEMFDDGPARCHRQHIHPEDQAAAVWMGALGMVFGLLGAIFGILALIAATH